MDKFTFIVGLQELGRQVAVTADGLNDVAALKKANVYLFSHNKIRWEFAWAFLGVKRQRKPQI